MVSHVEVIQAFGGIRGLTAAIGVDWKRAVHWPVRGIPRKYWFDIEDAATERGIRVTARKLREMSDGTAVCEAA
jgi:hypothetical protein